MCGITGYITNDSTPAKREVLESMNRAIAHRGPDDDGFYLKDNVGLAMRRLSIIDLASGKQPIRNADGTKWIVYNGEIYNYKELRRDLEADGHKFYTNSDTEAVVHLYDDHGPECLKFLRGMFALAIWDETEKSLFLARDRVGKKPLLYSHQPDGTIIFGSEFQALLKHPAISHEIDHEAIDAYLSYLAVPAPRTAFKKIRKLEPGHWLRWKDGRIETNRYWLPDFSNKVKISEEEAIEETTRILREATRLRMISEVPLGAFLSGGVDSSTIVALMAQESAKPVKTFSIGFEEQDYSELKYAKVVAKHVGAEHNEFIVRPNAVEILPTLVEHYGEPYADSSAIPTFYVARETRRHVTVALNGDGGDESFAGYERYAAMQMAQNYRQIPSILRRSLIEPSLKALPISETKRTRLRDMKRFVSFAGLPDLERYFRWTTTFSESEKEELYSEDFRTSLNGAKPIDVVSRWLQSAKAGGVVDNAMFVDQMTYLPNDLLVKVDIATMANSLEARSPFLDHQLIEFAASLPEDLKSKRGETKAFLKKVASRLIPKDVIYRRKMGFGVPIGSWLRQPMAPFLKDILLSEKSRTRGVFRPDVVQVLIAQHTSGRRDHSSKLWSLLMLELWFNRFCD